MAATRAYSRSVELGTAVTHTAASTGVTGTNLDTSQCKGMIVFINVTAITGTTPTLTVTLKGIDPASGTAYTILASSAINATGLTVLRVYPALPASANSTANDVVPTTCRIDTTIGGTTPAVTATVSAIGVY